MKPLVGISLLAGLAAFAPAQDTALKARELFYNPPPDSPPTRPATKKVLPARPPVVKNGDSPPTTNHSVPTVNAANVPLGMRYSVMKREGAGKFAEVDADSTFRSGDRIRLNVDSNTTGYLYVVIQGSSGNWQLLFPAADIDGGNNRIEKGSSQQIPGGDRGSFLFDNQSGTEKLFLVLTRKPEPDLDKLIYSITGGGATGSRTLMAGASLNDDIVNRLRDELKSRDLLFEKVDETKPEAAKTGDRPEKATYVVNPNRTDDARLVVDVSLKHGK